MKFWLAISLVGAAFSANSATSAIPQPSGRTDQSATVTISIKVDKKSYFKGEIPIASLIVTNKSSADESFPTAQYNYRIHIDGTGGEPPLTQTHRHMRGIYMPGETNSLRDGGVTLDIPPGKSQSRSFDLGKYYDLSAPGKYKLYIEYLDGTGKWLRTKTLTFEIMQN